MRTVPLNGTVDLSRRAVELGGWPSSLPRDPGAISDRGWNEELAGCRTPPITAPDEPKR